MLDVDDESVPLDSPQDSGNYRKSILCPLSKTDYDYKAFKKVGNKLRRLT